MEEQLFRLVADIRPADESAMEKARERQAALAKPPGSLGELETISIKLAGVTGSVNNTLESCRVIVMCADNGVIEEGVSCSPRSVTAAQAVNMTRRLTGMSSLAKHFGDDVEVIDVGIADEYDCAQVINRKIAHGTKNLYREPAMTRDEAVRAILTGFEAAHTAHADGVKAVGVGEMGIGNTTTSSAVLSVLLNMPVEAVTGRGGGLTDSAFEKKKRVIEGAIALHRPDKNDVIDVLSKVGGFDIAAMCGVFLGCAKERIPVVIDGFISVVAALCAYRLCPAAADYMFPSHASFETGYSAAAAELGLRPYLLLDMRLGEGSGCPIAFRVMEAACAAMNGMALFGQDSDIDDSYLTEIRKGDCFTV